ncbi:TetR/AcrR family transcriptional regulator [Neogemmobacter tilapiae]|uniref:TetR family transcriptional regulator n=1 Tax=Neogemmobacter tilapiae TaxID=875041 RepID=A0A918WN18_9RHOB|nr:TetR/AcrR family transcriptional regulator [Gemmobacter tilapiae]GHC61217.1 TetR family transcriptional regulator [Gemmobacter tilapiae]
MQLAVTPADARSAEILQSIRKMFADKGFDGASMQDLARAAGMSVGNFYRYFPSKAAIVEALVMYDVKDVSREFEKVMEAPDPLAAVRFALEEHVRGHLCDEDIDAPLWAEMSAAAMRKVEIATAMHRMEDEIKNYFFRVFAKVTGLSVEECAARFNAHVLFMMLMIKGSAMVCPPSLRTEPGLQALIMRAVDDVLADISAAKLSAQRAKG